MKRLIAVMLFLAACSDNGSVAVVSVDATPPITGVTHLGVVATAGGRTKTVDLPVMGTLDPAAPHTFAIQLPPGMSGNIDVRVDVFTTGMTPVANGTTSGQIVVGGRVDLAIHIGAGPPADLSATPDLSVSDQGGPADLTSPIIDLSGVDLTNAQPLFSVDQNPLNFNTVPLGQFLDLVLTVSNNGGASGALTFIIQPSQFVVASNDCSPSGLPPGGSCHVTIRFTPTADGVAVSGTIQIMSGAASLTSNLKGKGQQLYRLQGTIVTIAGGSGSMQFNPPGTSCGTNCADFASGTTVTISAMPGVSNAIGRWSQDCTSSLGNATCVLGMTMNHNAGVSFRPTTNFMFVSSGMKTVAQLGSANPLGVADQFCKDSANAAGLGGTNWTAWLSTSAANSSAAQRIFTTGGWIRVDGLPFALGAAALEANQVLYPPQITENNARYQGIVMTGTNADGTLSNNCTDFNGTGAMQAGSSTGGAGQWTNSTLFGSPPCTTALPIYCFEQSFNAIPPAPVIPANGKMAFVSAGLIIPGGGVSAMDTRCANEASAASINGRTFLAYVPVGTTSATSAGARVDTSAGNNWYRPDGVQITAKATDLTADDNGQLLAPIDQFASSNYTVGTTPWTGGGQPSTQSSSVCLSGTNTWSTNLSTSSGGLGFAGDIRKWFGYSTAGCSARNPIYCVQP